LITGSTDIMIPTSIKRISSLTETLLPVPVEVVTTYGIRSPILIFASCRSRIITRGLASTLVSVMPLTAVNLAAISSVSKFPTVIRLLPWPSALAAFVRMSPSPLGA